MSTLANRSGRAYPDNVKLFSMLAAGVLFAVLALGGNHGLAGHPNELVINGAPPPTLPVMLTLDACDFYQVAKFVPEPGIAYTIPTTTAPRPVYVASRLRPVARSNC